MSRLSLFLLGPPRIEVDGEPIKLDTRKATALLAYLALTGEEHTREALTTLLWPDYASTNARAALRRTLSTLNKTSLGNWLGVDRQSVTLIRDDDFWVDVEQFRQQLSHCPTNSHPPKEVCPTCLGQIAEAVQLYRDDFLAGFTLRDSPNFDEWQFFQTESLRRELTQALERLVNGYSAEADWAQAILYARQWLNLDPLHEPAHRRLMELYAWSNQRTAALRQYRECVRILDQELGVSPLEETTRLYQDIQENRTVEPYRRPDTEGERSDASIDFSPAPLPLRSPAPPPLRPSAPIVGRSAEWQALLETYAAIGPDGRLIVLEGEAGIGKTRLAEEFLAHVRARGGATLVTRCYEGETDLAYGPFVEGLRTFISQSNQAGNLADLATPWLGEAARLLPELVSLYPDSSSSSGQALPTPPPLDSPGAQSRFFEGVSQVLLKLYGESPPGVLFIDDLHWADEASLDLLTYLVRRLQGRPLGYLVAWREGQTGQRLRRLLIDVERAGTGRVLRLLRLEQAAVVELVRSTVAADTDQPEALGERLYRETEGLPFFIVEYLTTIANQTEAEKDSDWSMPGGVRNLLHSRLAAVDETGRQLLTTAAVIGRSFDFEVLRLASGRGEEETVTALERLIALNLVTEMPGRERGPVYDFNHEKLRTLVYEESSLARRRLLHRRVAEALAGRPYSHGDLGAIAGQIGHHFQQAGQETKAADYFKLAGEHARLLFANVQALAHFRLALALGHAEAASLHEAIGDLQTLQGEYKAALTAYETAIALRDSETLAGLEHKLGQVHDRLGEWDLAESHFQAALEALGREGAAGEQARLYADWSRTVHHRDQPERAIELAYRALELAERAADLQALAQTHNILGILANGENDLEKARHHLQQSLELAEQLADPVAQVAALNNLALAFRASGEAERAVELTQAALDLCASLGDRHREAALHNNLADLLHAAGQAEAAMTHLKQAVTLFAEIGGEPGTTQPEIWKLVEW